MLGTFNCTEPNCTVHCCISIACYIPHGCSHSSKHHKLMVSDSGATSNMSTSIDDFDPTMYKCCEDVFDLLGDGKEIPLLGYGP